MKFLIRYNKLLYSLLLCVVWFNVFGCSGKEDNSVEPPPVNKPPDFVFLHKIVIDNFPESNPSGAPWDAENPPYADLYLNINDGNNNVIIDGSDSLKENIDPAFLPVSFIIEQQFNKLVWNDEFIIQLVDMDLNNGEVIGYLKPFRINDNVDWKEVVSMESLTGNIKAKLYFRFVWN